jgi:hypothetical protein
MEDCPVLNNRRKQHEVIVRAWGDEPVQLTLHRIVNNRCYVGQRGTLFPIGLPFDQVFAFDSCLFSTMRQCFEQGKLAELKDLYSSLSVDELSCNKYQDNVSYAHDQEHLTDSECAQGGNPQ